MNIIEKLDEYGLFQQVVSRLEKEFSFDQVKSLIRGMSKTKYVERRFTRRLGDSGPVFFQGPKWNRKIALEGFDYAIRMDWRLEKVSTEEFLDTLLHELAHNIDFQIRGKSGHDKQWKCLASLLECRPFAKKDIGWTLQQLQNYRRQTSSRGVAANRAR